jgi:DNA-binding SARP family transcriptional activator/tetratricopeptide (TPR) repeat protein
MIGVRLLGPPRVERDGVPVAFDTRKAMAVLAYLALSERPRPRDVLADLLWADLDVDHARGALRRTLSTLRAAIGPAWVDATRDHVVLRSGADMAVDVHQFRALVADGDLEGASAYGGAFLEGFAVSGAPAFEDWQRRESESLQREQATVLAKVAAIRESTGDLAGATELVRRWLDLDGLHEPAHRALIRLLALSGNRAGALSQYRECVRTLDRELGVAPLSETTLLYEAISQGTLHPPEPVPELRATELALPPFVGRDTALHALLAAYRESGEHGRVAIIEGEAGVGKTRLAEEFLGPVRRQGSVTLVGRAYEGESALAYAPVVEALRARLIHDASWVDQVPPEALRQATRLLPELARFGTSAAVTADDPGAAERFLAGVWETLVAASAGVGPGVLVLDDAQWADEATLRLLTYGLRRLADRRIFVLLTWRSPHDHPVRRVVAELERRGHGSVHTLERLSLVDVGVLLDAAHPGRSHPGFRERLYAETEGLPLLLVEYLRALDLGFDTDEAWTLPAAARDLLRSRLDAVSETGRQILSAAAVLGRSFDAATVRSTSGRADDETVAALEELTQLGLIRESAVDYDFSHDKLRATVYADTSLARRRLLHGRAAHTAVDDAASARHLQLAGEEPAAAAAYVRAADQARSVFANAEALGHLRAALALGYPDAAALHAGIGDLQTLDGDYGGALNSYELAAATASRDRLSEIEHRLGQVHHRRGEWALADAHLVAALDLAPGTGGGQRARITADLSLAAHAAGDPVRAGELALEAHELATATDDLHALAQASNLLGLLATTADQNTEALSHLRSSLAVAERIGDAGARVAALNNLALAHRASGDLDRAVELTQDALASCAALGDRHREAALRNNLADLLHARGEPELAMHHLKVAVSLFAEIGADEGPQPEIWKLVRW